MRVGIIGLLHESNTFIREETTLQDFAGDVDVVGHDVIDRFRDAPHEIGGFLEGLQAEGVKAVPILAMRATPSGPLQDEVLQRVTVVLDRQASWMKHLDGVLAALHGAAVSQSQCDADGSWLGQLRERIGPDHPLIATLDLHANLSQQMVDATTALIGYRTNPHIDQRERGIEAARLMARTLRGEVKPTMAAAFPRVAINIERQLTAEPPCSHLYALADKLLAEPMVLSNSILLGFPYSDVPKMGSSAVVVTDNEPELARQLANRIAHEIEVKRHQFAGQFLSMDEALDQALRLEGPVCLLDMGDNVGGGAPGDGTALARTIHGRRIPGSFVCINDAQAAGRAAAGGIGSRLRLSIGGRGDPLQGPPLVAEVRVLSLHDGRFTETGTTHGGITQFDQGPTAIVRTIDSLSPGEREQALTPALSQRNRECSAEGGLTIMLTSRRTPPFSLRQLTSLGIDPRQFQILVAKGVHAPRAAYASACKHFLRVDTPGVTRADMTMLEYHHRRRPLFPFEEIEPI